MTSTRWDLAGLIALWAASAPAEPVNSEQQLLTLYASAYHSSIVGFMCYPARDPRYERMRHALYERRLVVRERLIERFGTNPVESIEREADEVESSVYRSRCNLAETEGARLRYGRYLRQLEDRLRVRP